MIDPDMRNAIYQLHLEGIPLRKISRQLQDQPQYGAHDHPAARADAQHGPQGQDPHRPGTAAASVRRVRRLDPAGPRKTGRGRRHPGQLSDVDAVAPRTGPGQVANQARCDRVPDEPGAGNAARHHRLSGAAGGPADQDHRQLAVPALLEAAVLEVLSRLQPLRDEVFSARSVDVLGLFGPAVHHRQHQPGAAPRQRQPGGDRPRDGLLRGPLRLPVHLPRDPPCQSQSRQRTKFLDGRDELPAGTHLRQPGGHEPAGVRVGHRSAWTIARSARPA